MATGFEAVGAASSIAALVELTFKVIVYMRRIDDAGEDIEEYYREAPNLVGLLTSLRAHIEQRGDRSRDPWLESIRNLQQGPMEQFRAALETFARKVAPTAGFGKKVAQRMKWPLIKDDVKDILVKIERLKGLIAIALQMDHFKLSQAIHDALSEVRDETTTIRATGKQLSTDLSALRSESRSHTALIFDIQKDTTQIGGLRDEVALGNEATRKSGEMQKKKSIAEWLSDGNYMDQQQSNISQYQEGTCKWLPSHAGFCEWEQGMSHTLLCVGIPGAGKTVLSAMLIRHLTQYCQAKGGKDAVAFLYFSYDQRDTDSKAKLLGRLSRQLVNQSDEVPSIVQRVFQWSRGTRPSDVQQEKMLISMVRCFRRIYFVVDALDEGMELHMEVVAIIRSLPKGKVKLFATSRPNLEIESRFRDALRIEVSATAMDIENYAISRFNQLPSRVSGNAELREQVVRAIVASTQGMFLLAKLNMDSLEARKRKVSVLKETLQKLPSGSGNIDNAYDEAMARIFDQPEDDRRLAQQVLTWIIYAMRPLSDTDLETALAIELEKTSLDLDNIVPFDELSSLCAGLVTVDKAKNVRLVHYTTQQYFSRSSHRLLHNPHRVLANTCVSYLGLEELTVGRHLPVDSAQRIRRILEARRRSGSRVYRMPFLAYAAAYWEKHNRSALDLDESRDAEQTMSLQLRLLGHQKPMISYLRALGHWENVERFILDPGDHTGSGTVSQKTGLQYAASRGSSQHVSALLNLGHDKDEATNGTTPLIEAARSLHEQVVKLLLDANANVHSKDFDGHNAMTVALSPSERSSEMFLEREDPNHSHEQARESIVALLLASKSDPGQVMDTSTGKTILMYAAQNGKKSIVAMLCRAGADVHARNKYGATALHLAAECGHEEVVRELLIHGCNPDVADSQNASPVILAAARSHWEIVDLLVNTANVDADRKTEAGDTVLTIACRSTDCPNFVIERLIEQHHCAVDARGAGDRTPLMVAIQARKKDIVKELLALMYVLLTKTAILHFRLLLHFGKLPKKWLRCCGCC